MHQIPLFCIFLCIKFPYFAILYILRAPQQTSWVCEGLFCFPAFTPYTLHLISYFATSTLQNKLLVIIEQQKVGFMIIFAAWFENAQP